jgi:hypothetical protein
MSMDIKDFYLNTILNRPEYMMIPLVSFPKPFLTSTTLALLFITDMSMLK